MVDVEEGTLRGMDRRHEGGVRVLAWDEAGARLASGSADDSVFLWRAADGVELNHLRGHGGDVLSLAFHPDGVRVFSGSHDRTLRVWHGESGVTLLSLEGFRFPVTALGFEREGRRLVTCEDSSPPVVRVWDSTLVDAQDMWREGEWARRAIALVNEHFDTLGGAREVRAALLGGDLEPQVLSIALVLLERREG